MIAIPRRPPAFLTGWWTIIVAVVVALWALTQFISAKIDAADTERLKAQQPFLTKQLDTYSEVMKQVGILITVPRDRKEWVQSEERYWQLYWSELSVVESPEVEGGMVRFANQLNIFKRDGSNIDTLQNCSYELAHYVRASIQARWAVGNIGTREPLCPKPDSHVTRWMK